MKDEDKSKARVKPKLRGSSHYAAFYVSLGAGALLLLFTEGTSEFVATLIYVASLVNLFGTSALYHRPMWSPEARARLRLFDHAAIFFLIAGTFTPFCVIALPDPLGTQLLIAVWVGAFLGIAKGFLWKSAPKFVIALVCVVLGWVAVMALPTFYREVGLVFTVILTAGGLLYTVGAGVYALKKPDPWPEVFGYHEIFHLFVVVAALCHFIAVTIILV